MRIHLTRIWYLEPRLRSPRAFSRSIIRRETHRLRTANCQHPGLIQSIACNPDVVAVAAQFKMSTSDVLYEKYALNRLAANLRTSPETAARFVRGSRE